jgi:hypothetical protein
MEFKKLTKNNSIQQFNISVDEKSRLKELLRNDATQEEKQKVIDSIFAKALDFFSQDGRALLVDLAADARTHENQDSGWSYEELHQINPILASYFGELLVQNTAGDKVISVYDRDRVGSMFQGARYHQTREGGTIHTDNVNVPETWDYLYLSCLAPALVGGENIIVDGVEIHHQLKTHFPKALEVLEENFVWEMRGVADATYEAPIITYDDKGQPHFRHLRPYMEAAHAKLNRPLTVEQLFAIDVLDALTNSTEFQLRHRMKNGEILITKDDQILHGRTCFSDSVEAVNFEEFTQGKGKILKRTMERMWLTKH